eukprot:COSAG01_NODE_43701_length_427_cov_0.765244_1_plen_77_part_01
MPHHLRRDIQLLPHCQLLTGLFPPPSRPLPSRPSLSDSQIKARGLESEVEVVCLPPVGGTMRLYSVTAEAWIAPLAA